MARSSHLRPCGRRVASARGFAAGAEPQNGPLKVGMAHDRFIWDATAVIEALGAAEVVLWAWEPGRDSLRLSGAAKSLGLGPLAPECSGAAVVALAAPQDRGLAEDVLRIQEPGT